MIILISEFIDSFTGGVMVKPSKISLSARGLFFQYVKGLKRGDGWFHPAKTEKRDLASSVPPVKLLKKKNTLDVLTLLAQVD